MQVAERPEPRRVQLNAETLAYSGLVLTSVAWTAAFIAGKVVLREFLPLSAAALRYLIAACVLVLMASRQPLRVTRWRILVLPLTIMTISGGVLYQWLFLSALQRTSATNASLLVALNPVFTLLGSRLVGVRVERRALTGVLLALAGAATITAGGHGQVAANLATGWNRGDGLAVLAAAAWAGYNLASRRVVGELSAAQINSVVNGCGGLILLAVSSGEAPWTQLVLASWPAVLALLVMSIVASVGAGQLFLYGVRIVGVSRTVVFVYLVPVMTALASALFLGEPILLSQVLGGVLVLAGLYQASRR